MVKAFSILFAGAFALVFFAFLGIFGTFPDEWQWIGLVIAGLGLAMATPSMFQMFWGRARILTEFEVSAHGSKRSLVLFLKNPPVENRLLRVLGVRRDAVQSLTAELRVSEFGSKRVIVPIRHLRFFSDEDVCDKGGNRITLPPTYSVGASIMVAMWDSEKNGAVILGDRLRQPLLLGEGYYHAQIIMIIDGEPTEILRQFVVGKNADDLVWAKPARAVKR